MEVNSLEEIPEYAADPEKAKEEKRIPAEIGLCYCNKLFRIERTLKVMSPEGATGWQPVGKAVNYAANHRELGQGR